MDLFNPIIAQNLAVIKTGTHPRAAHEVPLLTVIASLQIDMEEPALTSDSSGAPSTIERSPLDFSNENPSEQINKGDGVEDQGPETLAFVVPPAGPLLTTGVAPNIVEEEGTAVDAPLVSKRRRKRANEESNVNAPRKLLRKDFDVSYLTHSTFEGKSFTSIRLEASSTVSAPALQETLAGLLRELPLREELVDHLAPPEYFLELRHLLNKEFLWQFNMTLARQVAMGSQLRLQFEQEAKLLRKSVTQVAHRDQKISHEAEENLEPLLEAEADMTMAVEAKNADSAFKEFKKYEDEWVSARCAKMDSRLDALSIDFDEELYPHMLTAIAGRRWTFANMVSAGITKGFCDGLKYEVEQGEAKLDLAMVKGYDPEAEGKFIATMQALKDLKYPLIDELEKLRDAPMDVLMASLYLESDTRTDAPQWIRDLRPSSSQLKIPVYPEGLAILLADVTTQTDVLEEESSPKLTRSKSLSSM
ncbi:hypothetical protein Tco_0824188 [Tanacetum coccineum]|uniref:Transposase (Putative), gypsy type n=1 Tax=Tanacetum coccineum TaxID=301880 RepID=A0ABQ5ALU7_9ASTR